MSDERLERLAELARKAWPELPDVRVRQDQLHDDWPDASVVYDAPHLDGDVTIAEIVHPLRALDALEAALTVLAGEKGCYAEVGEIRGWQERADAAEARLAELQKRCRELAEQWYAVGNRGSDKYDPTAESPTLDVCADDLLGLLARRVVARCEQTGEPLGECGCFECDPEAAAERRAECDALKETP